MLFDVNTCLLISIYVLMYVNLICVCLLIHDYDYANYAVVQLHRAVIMFMECNGC